MPHGTTRLILAPAMLTVVLAGAACGSASPTAPEPAAAEVGSQFTLALFGTSTCITNGANGDVLPAASVPVVLEPGETAGSWRLIAPGQTLVGEIAFTDDGVEGYVRGSAVAASVRVSTGQLPDETVAFTGAEETGRYSGEVLVGTPRFEGLGAASGEVTTCESNGFMLTPV